jgi:EAL domain-containing protein (putative c-di-GMP-specific phosphodiesterase class I)
VYWPQSVYGVLTTSEWRWLAHAAWVVFLDVIAEGVETAEQLAQLQALGCEYGQEYYFSRPVDAETASDLIETWSEIRLPANVSAASF